MKAPSDYQYLSDTDFERHEVRFDKHDTKLRKRKKPRGKHDRDQMPVPEGKH